MTARQPDSGLAASTVPGDPCTYREEPRRAEVLTRQLLVNKGKETRRGMRSAFWAEFTNFWMMKDSICHPISREPQTHLLRAGSINCIHHLLPKPMG